VACGHSPGDDGSLEDAHHVRASIANELAGSMSSPLYELDADAFWSFDERQSHGDAARKREWTRLCRDLDVLGEGCRNPGAALARIVPTGSSQTAEA